MLVQVNGACTRSSLRVPHSSYMIYFSYRLMRARLLLRSSFHRVLLCCLLTCLTRLANHKQHNVLQLFQSVPLCHLLWEIVCVCVCPQSALLGAGC